MGTENGIREGGEVRRLKDGKIFADVHVSATGRISATEKVGADVVERIAGKAPEVISEVDADDFEPWDPENTNPHLPVMAKIIVGDFVGYGQTVAKVIGIEGDRAVLDIGIRVPVVNLKRVEAYAAISAMRRRVDNLVADVEALEKKMALTEETLAESQARVAKLRDDLRMREAQIEKVERKNEELAERVKLLETVRTLQQDKLAEVLNVGMRVYTLEYGSLEQDKATEFINLHLAHGAKHWTDVALGNGRFVIRIASRKPSDKVVQMPSDKAAEAEKDEVAV